MNIQITLTCSTPAEAAELLSRMAAEPIQAVLIAHADRPDVGEGHPGDPPAPMLVTPALPAQDPAAVFGGAVAPAAPPVAPLTLAPIAASLPTAATAPTAAPASAPDRDASGLPWDARIHASTKTRKADGTWTAKRNVDEALRVAVEAELRGQVAAIAQAGAVPPAPPAAPTLVAQPAPPAVPTLVAQPAPPAAPAATAVPTPPTAAEAGPATFAEMMAAATPLFTSHAVAAPAAMSAALAQHGLTGYADLNNPSHVGMVPSVFAAFKAALGV